MKLYLSIPEKFSVRKFSKTWKQLTNQLEFRYPGAEIISRLTGNSIEEADIVIFLYGSIFNSEQCKQDMKFCRKFDVPYNFIVRSYIE